MASIVFVNEAKAPFTILDEYHHHFPELFLTLGMVTSNPYCEGIGVTKKSVQVIFFEHAWKNTLEEKCSRPRYSQEASLDDSLLVASSPIAAVYLPQFSAYCAPPPPPP